MIGMKIISKPLNKTLVQMCRKIPIIVPQKYYLTNRRLKKGMIVCLPTKATRRISCIVCANVCRNCTKSNNVMQSWRNTSLCYKQWWKKWCRPLKGGIWGLRDMRWGARTRYSSKIWHALQGFGKAILTIIKIRKSRMNILTSILFPPRLTKIPAVQKNNCKWRKLCICCKAIR